MTAFNPVDPVHVLATVATVMPRGISVDLMGHEGVTHRTCFVAPDDLVPVPPVPTPVLFADINVGNRIRAVHVGGTVTEFTVTGTDTHAVYGLAASCVEGHWQFFRLTAPVPPEPEYEVGAVYEIVAAEQLAAKNAEIAAYRVLTEKLRVNGMTVDEVLAIVLGRTS